MYSLSREGEYENVHYICLWACFLEVQQFRSIYETIKYTWADHVVKYLNVQIPPCMVIFAPISTLEISVTIGSKFYSRMNSINSVAIQK